MKTRLYIELEADADELLDAVQRMRSARVRRGVPIVPVLEARARRHWEPYELLGVRDGDAEKARRNVDQLANQQRIDRDTTESLMALIAELERLTK